MKYGWLVLILTFSLTTSFGQLNWTQQFPSGGYSVYDVTCENENLIWTSGTGGIVLYSINGGTTWANTTIPGTWFLAGISFISPTKGWAVDYEGDINKTIDGGITWVHQYSNPSLPYTYEINFADDMHGWVSRADYILYTLNGGSTWDSVPVPTGASPIDIEFFNANVGYAMGGSSTIALSVDGGLTWDQKTVPSSPQLNRMTVVNSSTLYLTGEFGKIYYSENSGDTWTIQTTGTTLGIYGIDFFDIDHGIAVGDQGLILTTADGGNTWIQNNSYTTEALFGVTMANATTAWVTGSAGGIYKSQTGETDIFVDSYLGEDTVCQFQATDVLITVKNQGPGEQVSGNFTVTDSYGSVVIYYDWVGSILPSETETINIGTLYPLITDTYTCAFFGDSVVASSNILTFPVVVKDPGTITANDPLTICPGDSVELIITGGDSYYWFTSNVEDTLSSITVAPTVESTYMVYIGYGGGCQKSDTLIVLMSTDCGSYTNLAFSPNSDGVNDYPHIEGADTTTNLVTIYDRWGTEITSFTNYNNNDIAWHGDDLKGSPLTSGTYFYTFENTISGEKKVGWIQLVK